MTRLIDKSAEFTQVLTPEARGKVRYRIDTIYGPTERVGYRLSPHFVATKEDNVWRMTHLPSGLLMTGSGYVQTLAGLRRLAGRLEALASWGRYHSGRRPSRKLLARLVQAGLLKPLYPVP